MKKAILIPEERYNRMIDSYDKAMEELNTVKGQLAALQPQGNILTMLEDGDTDQALEDLFECYATNMKHQPPGQNGNYPVVIWKILNWMEKQSDDYTNQLKSGMVRALYRSQKQWFINGFRYAMGIVQAC